MPIDDEAQYRIRRGNEDYGPYSGAALKHYLATGNVIPSDYAWAEGADRWVTVAELTGQPPPIPPTVPGAVPSPQQDPARTLAIWSLVCGIAGIFCCGVVSAIPGIVLGVWALRYPPGPSRRLAISGLIVSVLALILGIASVLLFFLVPQFAPNFGQGFGGP